MHTHKKKKLSPTDVLIDKEENDSLAEINNAWNSVIWCDSYVF